MQNDSESSLIDYIQKQFLSGLILLEFEWRNFFELAHIDTSIQKRLVDKTIRFDKVLKYPLKLEYQLTFLKVLICRLESQSSEIDESLYDEYGRLVSLPDDELKGLHYKHYFWGPQEIVTLKETVALIEQGTTGLRTWQGALALSEWIIANPHKFDDKTILELGSGVGLTGLILAKVSTPQRIYLSDCHAAVLNALCENVNFNLDEPPVYGGRSSDFLLAKNNVRVLELRWEHVTEDYCREKLGRVDVIIASDVVYDSSLFAGFSHTLDLVFRTCGATKLILCCAERNSETLSDFFRTLKGRRDNPRYEVEEETLPREKYLPFEGRGPPLRLYTITPLFL